MHRRSVLLGTPAVGLALSGCSALSGGSPTLDVTVVNHADSPYTIELAALDVEDGASRSERRVFDTSLDVGADDESTREDVAESRPYLVRYEAYEENSRVTDEAHVHYYPPDDGADGHLIFDVDSDGILTRR